MEFAPNNTAQPPEPLSVIMKMYQMDGKFSIKDLNPLNNSEKLLREQTLSSGMDPLESLNSLTSEVEVMEFSRKSSRRPRMELFQ